MGADEVEGFGSENERQYGAQHGEEEDDGETEKPSLAAGGALVVGAVHEEVHGHRYHGEDAGGKHGEDASEQGEQEDHNEGLVFLFGLGVVGMGLNGSGNGVFAGLG